MSGSTIAPHLSRAASLTTGLWPVALVRLIKQRFAWIKTEWRIRRDIKALLALDDRMLADVGLSRGDVEHAARYGRWPVGHDSAERGSIP